MTRSLAIAGTIIALLGSGCALTSKADLVGTRYFTPESPRVHLDNAATAGTSNVVVRLGRVTSGAHIRERIAFHTAANEIGYYEDQQWTERPEVYVRRRLSQTLFEEHGFQHALGGSAPTLEVEVLAFDEVRSAGTRAARVELKVVLYEDRRVLYEETISVDRPVGGKVRVEELVTAMGEALDAATEVVAARIAAVKPARPAP